MGQLAVNESMNSLSRILRFLFWVLIVSWSVALLSRFIGWMMRKAMSTAPSETNGSGVAQAEIAPRRLVRDPVCGMHVAEEVAVPLRQGSEWVHFCSVDCRDAYAGSERKLAANG